MKKIKLFKSVLLLLAVFTFSMCEENGPIQFVVADSFDTTVDVTGLEGQKEIEISSSDVNISTLLDNADNFVAADVESVTITLSEYSGTAIEGNVTISVSGNNLITTAINLSTTPTVITIPVSSSDILTVLGSGSFASKITGTTNEAIEDDAFKLNLSFKIKATVQ